MPKHYGDGIWLPENEKERKKTDHGLIWFVVWLLSTPIGYGLGRAVHDSEQAGFIGIGVVYVVALLLMGANSIVPRR